MRFEKLNENKIRIILNNDDLVKNNVDFHDFMANPIDSQTVFFNMLDTAEKEIGFVTKNYNIRIEAIQVSNGDFILTITRSIPETLNSSDFSSEIKKKLTVKRKRYESSNGNSIYCFNNFDDFCYFASFLYKSNISLNNIAKSISLYEYKQNYYLVFSHINIKNVDLKSIFASITEFATYTNNSDLFKRKLVENGKILMKNNAIKTAIQYFS